MTLCDLRVFVVMPLLAAEKFEGVRPRVPQKARDAPQHAKRLDCARGFRFAHVFGFPSKFIQDLPDFRFRAFIIATNEHCRRTAGDLWINHEIISNGVECLYESRFRRQTLKALHQ